MPYSMEPCVLGHMLFAWYSAVWTGPEVENKWLRKSREKIAVRLEAQRMHASNIYTKTDGKETLRPLI